MKNDVRLHTLAALVVQPSLTHTKGGVAYGLTLLAQRQLDATIRELREVLVMAERERNRRKARRVRERAWLKLGMKDDDQ